MATNCESVTKCGLVQVVDATSMQTTTKERQIVTNTQKYEAVCKN